MPDTNLQVVIRYYTPYACSDNRPLSYHLSLRLKVHIADVRRRGSTASYKQLTLRNLKAKLFAQTLPDLGNFTHTHTHTHTHTTILKTQKNEINFPNAHRIPPRGNERL
jgi:hypothetical protein